MNSTTASKALTVRNACLQETKLDASNFDPCQFRQQNILTLRDRCTQFKSQHVLTIMRCREAFRAALVLLAEGAISAPGVNGPYVDSTRQVGFVNFGVSHLLKILGAAEFSQRSSWYQKWNVHMFARPEVITRVYRITQDRSTCSRIARGYGR